MTNAIYIDATVIVSLFEGAAISKAESKIQSFADLPEGWDYGNGGPIAVEAREIALTWDAFLNSRAPRRMVILA